MGPSKSGVQRGKPREPATAHEEDESGDDIQFALRRTKSPAAEPQIDLPTFWDENEDGEGAGFVKDVAPTGTVQSYGFGNSGDRNSEVIDTHESLAKPHEDVGDESVMKGVVTSTFRLGIKQRTSTKSRGKAKRVIVEIDDEELSTRPSPVPNVETNRLADGRDLTKVPKKTTDTSTARKRSPSADGDDDDGDENFSDYIGPDENDEYEVQEIVHHCFDYDDNCLKYLVHWLGWDDIKDYTWEPEENLANSQLILSTYKENNNIGVDEDDPELAETSAPVASMTDASKKPIGRRRTMDEFQGTKKGVARKRRHSDKDDVVVKKYVYAEDRPAKRLRRDDEAREVKSARLGGSKPWSENINKTTRKVGRPRKRPRSPSPVRKRGKVTERQVENISTTFTESAAKRNSDAIDAAREKEDTLRKKIKSFELKQEKRRKQLDK